MKQMKTRLAGKTLIKKRNLLGLITLGVAACAVALSFQVHAQNSPQNVGQTVTG